MAKHKNKREVTHTSQAMRDLSKIATGLRVLGSPVRLPTKTLDLKEIEDRRTIPHEIRQNRFLDTSGTQAQIRKQPAGNPARSLRKVLPPLYHKFRDPERVPVCIRRENRRRVLHALRKTGRGGSRRRAHWTAKSFIRCK